LYLPHSPRPQVAMDALSRSRGLEIRKRAKNGLWHRLCWRNLVFFVAPRSHRAANLLAMTIENKISSIGRVWFLSNISLRWAVALIAAVLFVLLAGTWLTAKRLTDDLLKKDATEDARAWAEFLAANVHDLEQIAAGEQPSHHQPFFFRGDQQDWASSPLCNLQQGRLFTASFRSSPLHAEGTLLSNTSAADAQKTRGRRPYSRLNASASEFATDRYRRLRPRLFKFCSALEGSLEQLQLG
jgi:hypothetical protein